MAVAAKNIKRSIEIVVVEPAGADDAYRSFRARHLVSIAEPVTLADGLRTSLGKRPFSEILRHVDDIVRVPDKAVVDAMRMIWEVMKLVVEPSGAVAYAAVVANTLNLAKKSNVGIVLSGGNLDLDRLPWTGQST